ncbi:MAG: RDD family protein [Candidatus Thermoplasmatota archaeon]|nr:RDD family protein [Candidatus Thermoplasmatota archaeon]
MALDPLLQDYRYEIKENMGRRALAMLIDSVLLAVPVFFFTAVFVFMVFGSNPVSLVFGQLAPVLYHHEVVMGRPIPVVVAMIPGIFISFISTGLYFTFLEVRGRRTLGKKLLHLETQGSDGKYLTVRTAFRRNLVKHISGAAGLYLFGILGFGLFMGLACLLDLKISPGRKKDVRQRFTEASLGTMVYLENDALSLGEISLPGEKIEEVKEKRKPLTDDRTKMLTKQDKPLSLSGAGGGDRRELPGLKKKPLLLAPPEKSREEVEDEKEKGPLASLEEPDPGEEAPPEEGPKSSFLSRIFGGSRKKKKEEGEVHVEVEPVPGPDNIVHLEKMDGSKGFSRDEKILEFMMDFDIDEARAGALYDMGYRAKIDLSDAVPQDLMMINGINPTIAKRIIAKSKE